MRSVPPPIRRRFRPYLAPPSTAGFLAAVIH